ncbi:MAG: hypothetical protein ACLTYN_05595 [Dysosmobacter welbionis]
MEEIRELLREYPDRFLSPEPPVGDPIASLLPDGDPRFRETVLAACAASPVRSAGGDCPAAGWEISLRHRPWTQLCGRACRFCWRRGAPRQPGASDPEWEERLERAEALEREKKAEVEALERRLARLKEELEQLPAVVDLEHALEMLAQAQEELSEAEARKERCLDQERSASRSLLSLNSRAVN